MKEVCGITYQDYGNSLNGKATVMWYTEDPVITYYTGDFSETATDLGAIEGSRSMILYHDTFINAGSTLIENTHYTLSNVPSGNQ